MTVPLPEEADAVDIYNFMSIMSIMSIYSISAECCRTNVVSACADLRSFDFITFFDISICTDLHYVRSVDLRL